MNAEEEIFMMSKENMFGQILINYWVKVLMVLKQE
jgi:hypothetical protein